MDENVMDKGDYENISLSQKEYLPTCSSSANSLEYIISHDTIPKASQEESAMQKQPWSKEEIEVALSNLPGGDIALSLIPTLHSNVLQSVLEKFQPVTLNKNEDRRNSISLATSADEIEQTILVDENRAAAMTPEQLLAKWPDTCLLISSWLGHVEIAKALLDKGVPVSTTDNDGRTPLHLAACTTSTKIVEVLLKYHADPCQWDFEKKCTPLHCAAAAGCVATVKCLIKSGADVNAKRSPLYYAVLNNAVDCLEALLQAGACPDNLQVYTKTLHLAVTLGNVHCIKLLLDHGANVTIQMGTTKSTALHLAAEKGNARCTKLLLEADAKTEIKNTSGQTAMHLATLAQSVETIKELIRFGAKVDEEDNEGRTPLHVAVLSARESSELIKILIQAGAPVNKPNKFGYTPLHIAALHERSHTVGMLLSEGGDVTARTKDGDTALSFIVRRTPEVLSQLKTRLDQAVSLKELGDMDCKLRVDFRPLVPLNCHETELILCLVEVGQDQMLKHPLCQSFLHLKWKRIRKFFVLSLLFHLIFVAFFTGFVCATYVWDKIIEPLSGVLLWLVFIITCLSVIKEILQITYGISHYTKRWENWLQWSVIVTSSIILIFPRSHPRQHDVAAVGILLAWIELMIVIGYFPTFGLYVQMFTQGFINFLKFLPAYFCLIIGFSLSFNVLHSNYKSFSDPLISLLKTVIMMSGELEFENVFFDDKTSLQYFGTAHVMLVCFVILVTVILMNLMIGMAVSDIHELRKCADFQQLVRHAEVIGRFENMLFSKLIDYTHAFKIIQACRENTLLLHSLDQYALHIRPNDPREKRLPRELIQSLYRLASEKKMRRRTFRGDAPPLQNVATNDMRLNRMYTNVSNQQQLDKLVAELKECSRNISIRLYNLTNKIENIAREQI